MACMRSYDGYALLPILEAKYIQTQQYVNDPQKGWEGGGVEDGLSDKCVCSDDHHFPDHTHTAKNPRFVSIVNLFFNLFETIPLLFILSFVNYFMVK